MDGIPLQWSWVNLMGAPIYQRKLNGVGDNGRQDGESFFFF
jgi:hypothetical protein